jgi:hypothetical protein
MVVGGIPVPRAIVSKTDVDAARSIVSGDEPPHTPVVVPARLHENVVHAFDDAVPVYPDVITIAVGPIRIDPNPLGTTGHGLFDNDRSRRWRRGLRGGRGLGLLNDDDRLPVDVFGRAGLRLDDHVGRRVGCLALLSFSSVAIV